MKTNTLSKRRIRRIINCFASGLTAIDTAHKLKLHRNTVNKYYRLMRDAIVNNQETILKKHTHENLDFEFPLIWHKNKGLSLNHIPEYDDVLFFAIAINSKNKIYLKAVKEAEGEVIAAQVLAQPQPTIASSEANADQVVVESEEEQQVDVPETVRRFYLYAKEKLTKFYGVKPQYTYLYLKELEFRFNNQDQNISSLCWKVISQYERKLHNEKAMAKKAKAAKKLA
ncbi:MAG: hypothetical protein ACPG5B_12925 [Chitinophagales bacterium]